MTIASRLERLGERLYVLAYRFRRLVARTAYAGVAAVAYAAAYLLRFDFSWPSEYTGTFVASLALLGPYTRSVRQASDAFQTTTRTTFAPGCRFGGSDVLDY